MEHVLSALSAVRLGGLVDLFDRGGPVAALLVALSVVALTITVAKFCQFWLAGVGRHGRARAVVRVFASGDDAAAAAAARRGGAISTRVVRHAIEAARTLRPEAARDSAESFAVARLHDLRRLNGLLDTIAQVSPLLGLFGTVLGMIEAFRALEGAGANVDPSILAGGIWVALLTTAIGLAVAMPASVLSAWFEGRVDNEQIALDGMIAEIFNGLAALPARGAADASGLTLAAG